MPIGPGKYDDVCTMVRVATGDPLACFVIVIGGNRGDGFSAQMEEPAPGVDGIAKLLEDVAKQLRTEQGKRQ